MIFDKYARTIEANDKAVSEDLEKIVENMDETIMYFKNLYNNTDTREIFDIALCIDSCFDFFEEEITINHIIVNKAYDSYSIDTYKDAFKHCLLILIENAIDALKESQHQNPFLFIESTLEGNFLAISLKDNGGGIKTHPTEEIFKIYYTTKMQTGTGLGLALAKMLIEVKLLGSIEVVNDKDGAIFTMRIPISREKYLL